MNPSNPLVIETHNLSKTYKGVQALKDLNLAVRQHSIFGFLGPNGAGKTTAIKLLLGLARPTAGSARVFGHDIQRESVSIRKRVGYLAQDPRYYEYMTARQILRFTLSFFFSGPKAALEERIQETLELVGLDDKADRPIKGFSGGERQRLGIAQAQVNYPDLLILDEPAASLDPQGRRDVLEVMDRLSKYATIFYSTQILDDVQRVSDTVAILNKGELLAQAPIAELLAGSGGATYQLKLASGAETVHGLLQAQPWVTGLAETRENGVQSFSISVSDEAAAQDLLLRLGALQAGLTRCLFTRQVLRRCPGGADHHGPRAGLRRLFHLQRRDRDRPLPPRLPGRGGAGLPVPGLLPGAALDAQYPLPIPRAGNWHLPGAGLFQLFDDYGALAGQVHARKPGHENGRRVALVGRIPGAGTTAANRSAYHWHRADGDSIYHRRPCALRPR
jgi:ABC-2 type transport system ATP-binding protein